MYERSASLSLNELVELLNKHGDVALLFSMSFSTWMMQGVQNDVREKGFPFAEVLRDSFNERRMIVCGNKNKIKSNEDALSYLNSGEAF